MRDRELLQQLFNALEDEVKIYLANDFAIPEWLDKTVATLRTRLAQPEPEPVAWMEDNIEFYAKDYKTNSCTIPLYTSPPKKEWVGLTREEIWHMSQYNCGTRGEFAKAIEAKLKEKNA